MKLSTNAEKSARESYYQALSAMCCGGTLRVFSSTNELLVESQFPNDIAVADSNGFKYANLQEGEVKKMGDLSRFVVVNSDGQVVLEGSIGTKDADMIVEEKDSRLFPGMKFGVDEFVYSKA